MAVDLTSAEAIAQQAEQDRKRSEYANTAVEAGVVGGYTQVYSGGQWYSLPADLYRRAAQGDVNARLEVSTMTGAMMYRGGPQGSVEEQMRAEQRRRDPIGITSVVVRSPTGEIRSSAVKSAVGPGYAYATYDTPESQRTAQSDIQAKEHAYQLAKTAAQEAEFRANYYGLYGEGLPEAKTAGDKRTEELARQLEFMTKYGSGVQLSREASTMMALEVLRGSKYRSGDIRSAQYYSGELQKVASRPIERASEYHYLGMASGIAVPANPWEYQGDLAVEFLKGYSNADERDWFSPVSGEMEQFTPDMGLQEWSWQVGLNTDKPEKYERAPDVSFMPAIQHLAETEGEYGPYGYLFGGPDYIGTPSSEGIRKQADFVFTPEAQRNVKIALEVSRAERAESGIMFPDATMPTYDEPVFAFDVVKPQEQKPEYNAAGVPWWADYPQNRDVLPVSDGRVRGGKTLASVGVMMDLPQTPVAEENEYKPSGFLGLGGLLPTLPTKEQYAAYGVDLRSRFGKDPIGAFLGFQSDVIEPVKSSLGGVASSMTFGLSEFVYKPTPITVRTQGKTTETTETFDLPTDITTEIIDLPKSTTLSGGNQTITDLGIWLAGAKGTIDRSDTKAVEEYNKRADIYNRMQEQNPLVLTTLGGARTITTERGGTKTVTTTTGSSMEKIYASEWDKFVEGSGRVGRWLTGETEAKQAAYFETIKNAPGVAGEAKRGLFYIGTEIINKPASLAPAAVIGVATSGAGSMAPSALRAMGFSGKVPTIAKVAVAGGFAGLYGASVVDLKSADKTKENIYRSVPTLAAMYGGAGGFNWMGETEIAVGGFGPARETSFKGVAVGRDVFIGGGTTPTGQRYVSAFSLSGNEFYGIGARPAVVTPETARPLGLPDLSAKTTEPRYAAADVGGGWEKPSSEPQSTISRLGYDYKVSVADWGRANINKPYETGALIDRKTGRVVSEYSGTSDMISGRTIFFNEIKAKLRGGSDLVRVHTHGGFENAIPSEADLAATQAYASNELLRRMYGDNFVTEEAIVAGSDTLFYKSSDYHPWEIERVVSGFDWRGDSVSEKTAAMEYDKFLAYHGFSPERMTTKPKYSAGGMFVSIESLTKSRLKPEYEFREKYKQQTPTKFEYAPSFTGNEKIAFTTTPKAEPFQMFTAGEMAVQRTKPAIPRPQYGMPDLRMQPEPAPIREKPKLRYVTPADTTIHIEDMTAQMLMERGLGWKDVDLAKRTGQITAAGETRTRGVPKTLIERGGAFGRVRDDDEIIPATGGASWPSPSWSAGKSITTDERRDKTLYPYGRSRQGTSEVITPFGKQTSEITPRKTTEITERRIPEETPRETPWEKIWEQPKPTKIITELPGTPIPPITPWFPSLPSGGSISSGYRKGSRSYTEILGFEHSKRTNPFTKGKKKKAGKWGRI